MTQFPEDMSSPPRPDLTASLAGRLVGGVFGLAFCGIGLTVLAFLWLTPLLAPFDGFGSPPPFFRLFINVFRLFGSFIAVIFVVTGAMVALSAFSGRNLMVQRRLRRVRNWRSTISRQTAPPPHLPSAHAYQCPHCGAPLAGKADVSPLGDVKCSFCGMWFNIHQAGRDNNPIINRHETSSGD